MSVKPPASGPGRLTPRSSSTQDHSAHLRISQQAMEAAIGIMFALALIATVGRTYARFSTFQRILIDDVFFYMAGVFLIAGTGVLYKACGPIYGLQMLNTTTPDLLPATLNLGRLQTAQRALYVGTVFSVKFSFLFFFKHLIWQNKRLVIWWWFTIAVCIPSALFTVFSTFIACHTFNERIRVNCNGKSALSRQEAALISSCVLDVITDAFLISIPIVLVWNARLSIRQKFALCGILCLSILMIIIAIIRVAWGKGSNGEIDSSWTDLWLSVEASVGVIVASISAFRALFVAHKTSKCDRKPPREESIHALKYGKSPKALPLRQSRWTRLGTSEKTISANNNWGIPDIPSPVNRVNTLIRKGSSAMSFDDDANGVHLPLQVHVRQDISRFENVGPSTTVLDRYCESLPARPGAQTDSSASRDSGKETSEDQLV